MNQNQPSPTSPAELLRISRRYWRRWLLPAVAIAALSALYVSQREDQWEATQALFVRNEAMNNWDSPGKFRHNDEMKITQETILQVALSRAVLVEALQEVGPSADAKRSENWPSHREIDALRESISITPPKGAEFGTTEVFYLKVRDKNKDRAVALATAVFDGLCHNLQDLREAKAQSMIGELERSVELAQLELQNATQRLAKLENTVGSDLAELRILHLSPADTSDLRRLAIDIDDELRETLANIDANNQLLGLLEAARHDPGQLLATPNRLLESLPALRRLKDGLVDAQLQGSQLRGSMSPHHPRVKASAVAEREIGNHIHNELEVAIRGLQVENKVNEQRVATLRGQLAAAQDRLNRIASLRAEYSNLVASVEHHDGILQEARRDLAEARASEAGATAASLIGRLDGPVIGSKPVGPSRKAIFAGGAVGGLAIGFGLLLLSVPPTELGPRPALARVGDVSERAAFPADGSIAGVVSVKEALRRANRSLATSS